MRCRWFWRILRNGCGRTRCRLRWNGRGGWKRRCVDRLGDHLFPKITFKSLPTFWLKIKITIKSLTKNECCIINVFLPPNFRSYENSIIVIQRQIIICAIIANIANDHCEYGEWNLLLPGIGAWIYLINHCKLTRRRKSNSFDFTVTTL